MTNDDRSNEDRTGDGQAPSWGDAPQQPAPAADEPRYGERVDPTPDSAPQYGEQAPRYGEHAPQTGEQQYGQNQYGEQNQYGQNQYGQQQGTPSWGDQQQHQAHQPYAAASAPASAGAPAWQGYEEPKRKKKTVGVVAFVVGLLSLVLGVIGGYIIGSALANSGALNDLVQGGSTTITPEQAQGQILNDPAVQSQFYGGAAVVGIAAILGLWALVQGIIAAVLKRGRGWGVFAIILAVVATLATFGTYVGVAAASAMGGAS